MSQFLKKRHERLQSHLQTENPALLEVLPTYYNFDKLLYRLGLLDRENSLASQISWWPLISVLGTFSSGKSTFINDYVGEKLQETGNQAVDDKFTVICHRSSNTPGNQTLPGSALDADPRFPFFRISREIEKVAQGKGKYIESYLQLRTTNQSRIKNRIIIDSPGFDADDQRRSILRITDHIVDLSDLVLVFFDARHPEPGAMQDTLEHLVTRTISRTDASKFCYVLNQIDTAAKEDNPEEIVAAWQRSIAQAGLGAGPFYTIYNEAVAIPIEDAALRERFRMKRDRDLQKILERMDKVDIQRNYRIIGVLETVANELESDIIPRLRSAIMKWRRGVLLRDGITFVLLAVLSIGLTSYFHLFPNMQFLTFQWIQQHLLNTVSTVLAVFILLASLHYWIRGVVASKVAATLPQKSGHVELNLRQAFLKSAGFFHSIFRIEPVGWAKRNQRKLRAIRETVANHIQALNDRYTDPSGNTQQLASKEATSNSQKISPTNEPEFHETEEEAVREELL